MKHKDITVACGQPDYDRNFWNYMRGDQIAMDRLEKGRSSETNTYAMPTGSDSRYEKAITCESVIRQIASVFSSYDCGVSIMAAYSDDIAEFVPELGSIPIRDVIDDFTKIPVSRYKLATLLRLPTDFVSDSSFDLEGYLIRRLAKSFARAEDRAFISGNGVDEPTGLLHDSAGAEIGATTSAITYDDVIDLYFSVKPEYRRNGVWLMNDETALALKKLKDDAGNYLWRGSDDTIMGKPVMITEYMPSAEAGTKPVLFGDYSYYWIVKRSPVTVKMLRELFAIQGQTGYPAFEFIDGKLIRREAVKALQITSA